MLKQRQHAQINSATSVRISFLMNSRKRVHVAVSVCLHSLFVCLVVCHYFSLFYVLCASFSLFCAVVFFCLSLLFFFVFFSHSFIFLSDPLACSLLLPLFSKVLISPIFLSVSSSSFHTLHAFWRSNTDKRQCSEGYNMHSASRTLRE